MAIIELFSQRKHRLARAGQPDVYQYDEFPEFLRVQVQHILSDAIGSCDMGNEFRSPSGNYEGWKFLRDTLCREKGLFTLTGSKNYSKDVLLYVIRAVNTDDILDVVELCFRYIDRAARNLSEYAIKIYNIKQTAESAIEELNHRLRAAGVGYQYENGEIIRVDSQFVHAEVVKPALQFLSDARFAGAQDEYLNAHRHYRVGNHKEAIIEAAKAFESSMKSVCDIKGWKYEKGARASDLAKILRREGYWPDYLDTSFDQLIATLTSGLPKVRNDDGAHGQGAEVKQAPDYIAAYALHLAAAKIVLLGAALG